MPGPQGWLGGQAQQPGGGNGGDGGAEGSRTPDLCSAIAALSQLSYGPAPAATHSDAPVAMQRRLDAAKKAPGACRDGATGAQGGPRGASEWRGPSMSSERRTAT